MKVAFITLGCKTNIYESEAISQIFRDKGHIVVPSKEMADVYIVNTCTVTSIGAQKSRQALRKAKHKNSDAIVVAMGCLSQTEPEKIREIPEVDIVIGNGNKGGIVNLCEEAYKSKEKIFACTDISKETKYEELALTEGQSRIRANVKIEDGCNNFCTYCIIPYACGRVRSRSIDKIVEEVKLLAKSGYKEVVLTGIHIGSYGRDLADGTSLIDVIEAVCSVEGIARVRLGSIEPVIITEEFVARAKKLKNLCPQFHLALQSGCDETLKRMNRHYTTDEFRKAVKLLRDNIPDTSITTDFMVGFPGETDEEFEKSYEFCREIGFMQMHIFKYSIRKGTKAEKMPDQVPDSVKDARSQRMLDLAEKMKQEFYGKYKGRKMRVLVELCKKGVYHGTTDNYMDIYFKSDENLTGKFTEIFL
ncbi:MAG: tRNA (N(6)-L-threonylcarbamoyladenosine(37)-C(2))-methylthiotransferase MtaB [Clostridia bacterium]|nr:tRNA (N(6)-L-threonylcarbamoyladenosine(37)-C(2))-methylthiotransferase MtaB [Clostridia bacterium]